MNNSHGTRLISVFTTSPQSCDFPPSEYAQRIRDVARWSEESGCVGILVYTDNRLVDPWIVSQIIIQSTHRLCPLVAVQPIYMQPYTVANLVSSFAHLYNRRVFLNMVAGGFKRDLIALNDQTPHDERYNRLVEYTTIIQELLARSTSGKAYSFEGQSYKVAGLKLEPSLPEDLLPDVFVSGSSDAGLAAARALGASAIRYPADLADGAPPPFERGLAQGIRIGIIAREEDDAAWQVAHKRFPEDRKGQLTHQMAMKVSDSKWHKQLSQLALANTDLKSAYWMIPFENYKTFCPYFVGSYERVAQELGRYVGVGYNIVILDIPRSRDDMIHIGRVFDRLEVPWRQ